MLMSAISRLNITGNRKSVNEDMATARSRRIQQGGVCIEHETSVGGIADTIDFLPLLISRLVMLPYPLIGVEIHQFAQV
jgi:hypothetical protein